MGRTFEPAQNKATSNVFYYLARGNTTIGKIAKQLKLNSATVSAHMQRLVKAGFVSTPTVEGVYRVYAIDWWAVAKYAADMAAREDDFISSFCILYKNKTPSHDAAHELGTAQLKSILHELSKLSTHTEYVMNYIMCRTIDGKHTGWSLAEILEEGYISLLETKLHANIDPAFAQLVSKWQDTNDEVWRASNNAAKFALKQLEKKT